MATFADVSALEDVSRVPLLAAEARLVHADHDAERAPLRGREELREAGPALPEQRARHRVVAEDVLVRDRPALLGRERAGVLDLTLDRDRVARPALLLLGGLPGVDRSSHEIRPP